MGLLQGNSGGGGSGRSGCTLMLAALGVFITVIIIAIWTLVSQDRAIAKFAQEDPTPTPVVENVPKEEVDALRTKLDAFSKAAKAGEASELRLSIHELNLIIAFTDSGDDYREMVYFTGTRQIRGSGADDDPIKVTQGRQLVAQICLKMNKLKFWGDRYRYLVGEAEFDLRIVPAGLDLVVTGIYVPEKEVPQDFIASLSRNWHWMGPFNEDAKLKPVFLAMREVEILDGGIVIRSGGNKTGS